MNAIRRTKFQMGWFLCLHKNKTKIIFFIHVPEQASYVCYGNVYARAFYVINSDFI